MTYKTIVDTVALLSAFKDSYPCRVPARDIAKALKASKRTAQRKLKTLEDIDIVYTDNEEPFGWRLTEQGKQLLGIQ